MTQLRCLLLALFCIACARPASGCELDCAMAKLLHEQRLAGAVYGLVDGDTTHLGAVGLANHATGQPLRVDSRVHIGSVTKTLIALGVLRLVTQGRLSLDTSVDTLLPDVPIENPWRDRAPITVRHLLDHTAGLDDLRLWQLFTRRAPARAPLRDTFARTPDLLRARVEPGTRFSYSNMGYTLAGLVIETVTRERYEAWLDRELLQPLRLDDSTFEFVSQTGPAADARLAWGHHDDFSLAEAAPVWIRPAAQFTTTAADMAKLARFLLGDGRIGSEVFIEQPLLRVMGHASNTSAARAGLEVGYALGLARRDRHGAVGLCHLGNIVGYRAALCVYPHERKAYFIAHNMDSESAQYTRFDELLTRQLGVRTPTVATVAESSAAHAWQGRYVLSPARFERFRLFDLLFDSVRVRADGQAIEWRASGGAPVRLLPVGASLYRAGDRTLASHVLLNASSEYLIADGTRTFRKLRAGFFEANWLSFGLGLVGFSVLLLLIPWRALRVREPVSQPASWAILLLLLPLPLFATQSFMALGDLTPASAALYAASIGLPILMVWHIGWATRHRRRVRSWKVHVAAAALVLQWSVLLWAWDLLPFASWR